MEFKSEKNSFDPKQAFSSLLLKHDGNSQFIRTVEEIRDYLNNSIHTMDQTTCCDYENEAAACCAFDGLVNENFFKIEREVQGRRLFDDKPKIDDETQRVRIDRILHPTKLAIESGWELGPIAVEIKQSKLTIGPIYAQLLEYRQSVFFSKLLRNTRIMPMIFSVFPTKDIKRDLHSIQRTQSILSCFPHDGGLRFNTFGTNVLDIYPSGINVNNNFSLNTTKGHRGRKK